ncbi:MAG: S-methyl-5-thioribose-1-phosphate isomerase [candidate division WOR-3 bacterium]
MRSYPATSERLNDNWETVKEINRLPSFLLRAVSFEHGRLTIIDQTQLPARIVRIRLRSAAEAADAIQRLAVRGAPNIGVAAAYGLAAEANRLPDSQLRAGLARAARQLVQTRPTAVNLKWAVERVMACIPDSGVSPAEVRQRVVRAASEVEQQEVKASLAIARHGSRLVPDMATVLTICNTGALAGPGLGTALGIVFACHTQGRRVRVVACETRPLLQGARLTMLELKRARIPALLITDNTAASIMSKCDVVVVGADRVAGNGDFANKVGTRMLAVLAQECTKPFYVAAPSSTFDLACPTGKNIKVEQRPSEEVTSFGCTRVAPRNVRVFNPAFDVTPGRFVTAFVTEKGIIRRPYIKNIARTLRDKK